MVAYVNLALTAAFGDGDHDFFFSDENNAQVDVMVSTHGESHTWVSRDDGNVRVFVTPNGEGGAHARRLWLHADGTTLRCPEGDTTMHLQEGDEDEGPFYCPKHDIKLEKVDRPKHSRRSYVYGNEDN